MIVIISHKSVVIQAREAKHTFGVQRYYRGTMLKMTLGIYLLTIGTGAYLEISK